MRGRMPQRSNLTANRPIVMSVSIIALTMATVGCSSLWKGSPGESEKEARLRELMTVPDPPDLIREAAITHGMRPIQVDGVAAVNGLPGTGGPPSPSLYRDQLLDEMKRLDIASPHQFLERDETALVRVRAVVPPGARRGDPLDLRIISPPRSEVADLHGGWLLESRLRHQQVLQSKVRKSDVMVVGRGSVLTRADYDPGSDDALRIEGRVLAGGRVQINRKLGLVLRPKFEHVKMSATLASAINRRFFFFDGTTRRGIATPIEDDFIELEVHPRYRRNENRMMAVVLAIGVKPESSDTQSRLADLAKRLSDPATAADAALQLEALGESAIPTLLEGLESNNPELRFYAAEALGYLDRSEAIEPLEEAARNVAAFRQPALLALQGLDLQLAVDSLVNLMNEPSIETRYGSFGSIRRRKDSRLILSAKTIGDEFRLYRVASTAAPAVVVSLREQPEIVVFGEPSTIQIPDYLMGPSGLMLKPEPEQPGQLRISRFRPGKEDQRVIVGNSVDEVMEGIVAVGGGYGDVVAMLRLLKDKGYMADQLAIDPVPKALRTYYRDEASEDDESEDEPVGTGV